MWFRLNPARDALFLDIDGTLLDIAPTAQDVVVPPKLVKDLGRLATRLNGALAFVSGRMIDDIDRLFDPLCLPCSGSHGAEWRLAPDGKIQRGELLPDDLRDNISLAFNGITGVYLEDKIYSVSVHYRQDPAKEKLVEDLLSSLVKKEKKGIKLIHGRKVFEVTRASQNKGGAIDRLLATPPFKGRRPVFLGDDITDISAIGACMRKGGIAARVGQGKPDQKNAFPSPEKVRSWINDLVFETN
jgi:trehalose 6-phosphate phosphatase